MPKSRIRSVNEPPEMSKISGNTIGQVSLEVCPNPLIGIKLRRISGEVNGMDSRISFKESLGEFGFVKRAAVPEEEKRASDLAAEMPEKLSDLLAPNVSVGIKAGVEAETLSLGRDCDGGDRRDLCPFSGNNEGWSFSSNRPGPLDVGDKREPAFVEEDDAGFEPFGLFLYEAKRNASSDQWLSPCVPGPASAASGRSSPSHPSDSKGFRYSNALRNSCVPPCRSVSKSKDPLNNRLPEALSPRCAPRSSSVGRKDAKVSRDEVSALSLSSPSCGRLVANAPESLSMRPVSRPLRDSRGLALRAGRPCAAAFPAAGVCHEVSLYPPRLPLYDRLDFLSIER